MLTAQSLSGFTGTEGYTRYLMGINLTDGVKYLADEGKAWWLLDAICSYQPKYRGVSFQIWTLKKEGNRATLTMKEDSDKPCLVTQRIPYTDFPLEGVELYLIDGVLLLTSEY